MEVQRKSAPSRVRRSTPSTPPGAISVAISRCSVPALLLRFHRPELEHLEGPAIASDADLSVQDWPPKRQPHGEGYSEHQRRKQEQQEERHQAVEHVLELDTQRRRRALVDRQQRDAAEVVDAHVLRNALEQPRHDRDPDAATRALVHHPEHHLVGRLREREDDVLDTMRVDHLAAIPARTEHGQRHTARVAGERLLVEKTDRVEPDLAMLRKPLRDQPADATRTDDERRHGGVVPTGGDHGRDDSAATCSQVDRGEQPETNALRR